MRIEEVKQSQRKQVRFLVKLEDGWYHVDIYSDAHGVLYGNFNMTDQTARNGHNWDESALPEAKSVKYSPAVQNAVEVDGHVWFTAGGMVEAGQFVNVRMTGTMDGDLTGEIEE